MVFSSKGSSGTFFYNQNINRSVDGNNNSNIMVNTLFPATT